MATKRVNIRVAEEIHSWFMVRSEQTGVPMSALMALALEEHMVQRQALNTLTDITNFANNQKVDELVEK